MNADALTPDSKAVLLLCSTLALARSADAPKPLSRTEWNELARAIHASELKRPGTLFGVAADRLQQQLGIDEALAARVTMLLSRGGQLSIELARLQSLGIWTITRADDAYPPQLKERLKAHAPPVLFGAGNAAHLRAGGVAIVGSRNVDDEGAAFAANLGARCGESRLTVFSGGARGVDRVAVDAGLAAGGNAVALLADSLEDTIKRRETREHLLSGTLALVTPMHPAAKFSAGAAMGRNKLIYALATWAVVVASDAGAGGTWAGATENLRARWVPLFVRNAANVPVGNRELLDQGGLAISDHDMSGDLAAWFTARVAQTQPMLGSEPAASFGGADLFTAKGEED